MTCPGPEARPSREWSPAEKTHSQEGADMRRSPATFIVGTLAIATVALGSGCVPQDKYDALLTTNNSLKEEIVRLNSENDQSRQTAQMMQERFANANAQLGDLQNDNNRLKAE